jgi:hypothetical protein
MRPLPSVPGPERVIAIGEFNVTDAPLLPIPVSAIIPPTFHILMGLGSLSIFSQSNQKLLGQKVIDIVEQEIVRVGKGEELDHWLKTAHCRRRKRGQNYTGYLLVILTSNSLKYKNQAPRSIVC